jgi:hypothetical protein
VTLFWKALQPLDDDYRVSLILRDTQGQAWGTWDGRPGAYYHPTERWRVDQVIFGRYDLKLLPGAPPGDYGLEVGVYTEEDLSGLDVLDAAGAAQGKRAMLGAVALSVAAARPDEVEAPHPQRFELGDGLALLGWDLDRTRAQPGDKLLLTLFWSVEGQPQGDDTVGILVTDAAGQVRGAGTFQPTNPWHPTSIWLPGQAWRGQITFRLPVETEPGAARLSVQLIAPDGSAAGPPAALTTVEVASTNRIFVAPQPQARRQANFEDVIALTGADLGPSPASPGGVIRVTLYWQTLAEMDVPYSVFVHLLDVEGRVVAGHDGEPAFGARPTTGWVPGEYVDRPARSVRARRPAPWGVHRRGGAVRRRRARHAAAFHPGRRGPGAGRPRHLWPGFGALAARSRPAGHQLCLLWAPGVFTPTGKVCIIGPRLKAAAGGSYADLLVRM